jgi:hypothetical protein
MRFFAALLFALVSGIAGASAPQPGLWWNPSQSGRGYSLDTQGGLLVLTVFAYDGSGRMQWYYADGPLSADGTSWSGTLLRFDNGQPLAGGYRAPTLTGNDGPVSIVFSSRVTGTLTMAGVSTPIQRQNFGVGEPPQALLGDWLMAYSIGSSSFADRYGLRKILSATTNGNGVVSDNAGTVGAELQVRGSLAGQIVMAHFTSSGTVLDQYLWTLHMEEGRGSYIGLASGTFYGMNVYKTMTPGGIFKAREAWADLEAKGAAGPGKSRSIAEVEADDPVLGQALREMWDRINAGR